MIYIDPPYNTGARDWKYNNSYVDENDGFRHSKWLNMMYRRLKLAKKILKNDGVLICAIDENEIYNLGELFQMLFKGYEIHLITVVHNPRGIQGSNFSYVNDFIFFVFKKKLNLIGKIDLPKNEWIESNFRNWGGESLREDAKNCFYPILVKNKKIIGFGDVLKTNIHPTKRLEVKKKITYVWPIDKKNVERKWRYARQSVESIKNMLHFKDNEIHIRKKQGMVKTVWTGSRYDASVYGTKLLNSIIKNAEFEYPKSLYSVYDCLVSVTRNKPNAIILDFFAGSGTTGHAVMKLNNSDGGSRRFILCTNNENNICRKICYPRLKNIIKGYKNTKNKKEEGLGGTLRYFKTTFINNGHTDNSKKIIVQKLTEILCLKENCFELIVKKKYFAVYRDRDKYFGIIYHYDGIKPYNEKVLKINKKINTYVFSLSDMIEEEDFENVDHLINIMPIPYSILNIYQRIFTHA